MRQSAAAPEQDLAQTVVGMARAVMDEQEGEWWVVFVADASGQVHEAERDYVVVWQGARGQCPIPDGSMHLPSRLRRIADRAQAQSLVSVRYQISPWDYNFGLATDRLAWLQPQAEVIGLPLWDHLVVDASGVVVSFRSLLGGRSGNFLRKVLPKSLARSMPATMYVIAVLNGC